MVNLMERVRSKQEWWRYFIILCGKLDCNAIHGEGKPFVLWKQLKIVVGTELFKVR